MCGGVMLEMFVLLRCYVMMGRVANGYGGGVISPLGQAL